MWIAQTSGSFTNLCASARRLVVRGQFSATDIIRGRSETRHYPCVIKCAGVHATADPNRRAVLALQREFEVYSLLKEQPRSIFTGCVEFYDKHELNHYLVLESFGQELRALLTGKRVAHANQLIQAVVAAVRALHTLGIMHGDLKPQNILWQQDAHEGFVVRLCDLDAAYKVDEYCAPSSLGTKFYVAPEVLLETAVKIKASLAIDMFSLGLVIWQILQPSAHPALLKAEHILDECYRDQTKLNEYVPSPPKSGFYDKYLRNLTSLKPHLRMSSQNLLVEIQFLSASNAQLELFKQQSQDEKMEKMTIMLHTLLRGTHMIPTLAVILPDLPPSSLLGRVWAAPMNLVRSPYRLYFLCSHTRQVAICGPEGLGYRIEVTKQWVLDAAPVLRVGLVLLKLALMTSGIPIPVPDLSPMCRNIGLQTKYLQDTLGLIGGVNLDASKVDSALETIDEIAIEDALSAHGGMGRGGMSLQEGSMKAHELIKEVLKEHMHSITQTCGLRQVTHKGKGETAWVMDNDATEQAFLKSQ